MKNNLFITFLLAAAMAILSIFGCAAQENVAKAFNNFIQKIGEGKNIYTMCKSIDYRDKESGEVTGVCLVNEFRITSSDKHLITDLTHAMSQDSENAYHSASGAAGSKGVTYALAYGTGKNDFELIGADDDMNFMVVCFKNKKSSDFRTSYAIEWKQENGRYYTGKIYKIFGKKPDDYKSSKMIVGDGNGNFTLNIDSLIDLKDFNGFKDIKTLKSLEGLGEKLSSGLKLYTNRDNGNEFDNSSWLTTFAMYCNKFKEKAKQSPNKGSVYATELLQMCKRADGIITSSEKKLCIKSLKECQKCTSDTFVTGLFEEAINWLNGKYKDESHNSKHNKTNTFKFG